MDLIPGQMDLIPGALDKRSNSWTIQGPWMVGKGENSTPTWMLLHISQREIISKEKNFIERSRVIHLSCWTITQVPHLHVIDLEPS